MYTSIITGAAMLLALAPSVMAVGSASVTNMCPYTIYYASIAGQSEAMTAMASGGSMSEAYTDQGQGVSIKLALNDTASGPISQFEFTWTDGKVFYDLSNINGYPFASGGITVTPSMENDPNNPTCVPIVCPAGQAVCSAAYNQPDDTDTLVCDQDSSISLVLCSGGNSKRDVHVHQHPKFHSRQIRHPHGRVWVTV